MGRVDGVVLATAALGIAGAVIGDEVSGMPPRDEGAQPVASNATTTIAIVMPMVDDTPRPTRSATQRESAGRSADTVEARGTDAEPAPTTVAPRPSSVVIATIVS